MRQPLLIGTAWLLLSNCAILPEAAPPAVKVDGLFGDGEWDFADREPADPATILSRRVGEDWLVAARLPNGALRYLDLYVQDASGRVINFHTSMRQGERVLEKLDRDGGPSFTWEPTSGWEGSIARGTGAPRTGPIRNWLAPLEGYELRIPLALLGPGPWRVRYELRDFVGSGTDWVFPADSVLADTRTWAHFGPTGRPKPSHRAARHLYRFRRVRPAMAINCGVQ